MPQNALFLFDGPNFFKNLKSLKLNKKHLNYRKLAENLSLGRNIIDVIFFTSPTDHIADALNYQNQQKFFAKLKQSNVSLKLGNLVTRNVKCPFCKVSPVVCDECKAQLTVKTEKSVDVQIAMEIILGCVNNTYDCLYLASCDSDLIPAIDFVKNRGKIVFLLLPENNGTPANCYAVGNVCNSTLYINQSKIDAAQ